MDIVLIPGALATSTFWFHQEQHFQRKIGVHHVPDLSGACISRMAEQMIPSLPNKFSLVGFSLGGYIALELMRHIPHQIEKLILINSGARPISEKGITERERSVELIKKGQFDFLIRLIFKNSVHDKNKHAKILPHLQDMAHVVGAERYINQLTAVLNKPDHSELLKKIQCPTLLIASREDKIMPTECSEHMAKHIKDSTLVYLENCGHVAPLEQPDMINRMMSSWLLDVPF